MDGLWKGIFYLVMIIFDGSRDQGYNLDMEYRT